MKRLGKAFLFACGMMLLTASCGAAVLAVVMGAMWLADNTELGIPIFVAAVMFLGFLGAGWCEYKPNK